MENKIPSLFTQFNSNLLRQMDQKFWEFQGSKFNFLELSHRSKYYADINQKALTLLGEYFHIPENYEVLLLHNGVEFSAIPFNLNKIVQNRAIYIVNDKESEFAFHEAAKINPDAVKITDLADRQIYGQQFAAQGKKFYTFYNKISIYQGNINEELIPFQGQILVCNLNYCSHYETVDVADHGVVFFETGHGFGIAGMCVTFVRKDLIKHQLPTTPDLMCFQFNFRTKSIINTPFTLVSFILAEYGNFVKIHNLTHKIISSKLASIKKEYELVLEGHVELIPTSAIAAIRFKIEKTKINLTILQNILILSQNEFIIYLQLVNEGASKKFLQTLLI